MNWIRPVMRGMAKLASPGAKGDDRIVRLLGKFDRLRNHFARGLRKGHWPSEAGDYVVGDRDAPVAICTLTTPDLMSTAIALPRVAICGRLHTPNLGIEKIVRNVISNPAIRVLLVCGKESPVFYPGQALLSLAANGVDQDRKIIGAIGPSPVLRNTPRLNIETFRRQVKILDCVGETDLSALHARVSEIAAKNVGRFRGIVDGKESGTDEIREINYEGRFQTLQPGGRREPLTYDPNGFFIVSIDRDERQIICQHYRPDNSPAHEMRARSPEAILLGLLRENLISQMSHAGYLGGELAKADQALRTSLVYEQDRPLRGRAPGD